jgi:hypothetical protein
VIVALSATTPTRSFLFIAFPHSELPAPLANPEMRQPLVDSARKARISGVFARPDGAMLLMDRKNCLDKSGL